MIAMDENNYIRQLFKQRAMDLNDDIQKGMINRLRSPTYEILKISINFGEHDLIMKQLFNQEIYTKTKWETVIWKIEWDLAPSTYRYATHSISATIPVLFRGIF